MQWNFSRFLSKREKAWTRWPRRGGGFCSSLHELQTTVILRIKKKLENFFLQPTTSVSQPTSSPVLMHTHTDPELLSGKRAWDPPPLFENNCTRSSSLPCPQWSSLWGFVKGAAELHLLYKMAEGANWIRHWNLTNCHLEGERDQISLTKGTRRKLVKDFTSPFSQALKLGYISNSYRQKYQLLLLFGDYSSYYSTLKTSLMQFSTIKWKAFYAVESVQQGLLLFCSSEREKIQNCLKNDICFVIDW